MRLMTPHRKIQPMSLSNTTLSAIQQAGAAVFAADAELKNASRDYAERVNAAMVSNPFGLGNDALFENWKLVARLAQTMAGIEQELKKVHQLASDLTADDAPTTGAAPALAAPTRALEARAAGSNDLTPTDVRAKRRSKAAKPAVRATRARRMPTRRQPTQTSAAGATLNSNPAKLLQHLQQMLNADTFTELNQTASAQATGIPLGSMTAAIKKLVELNRIVAGQPGSFKLVV